MTSLPLQQPDNQAIQNTSHQPQQKNQKPKKKKTQDQKLIEIATNNEYFYDNLDKCYAKISSISKLVDIQSGEFGGWLSSEYFAQYKELPNFSKLKTLTLFLHHHAKKTGTLISVNNRVAIENNIIWIDLSDQQNHAVKVTASGWEVVANPPVYFKTFSHAQALPVPERNGNLAEILPFLNISSEEDTILLMAWLVVSLVPDIPKPFLWLVGGKDSGKTTTAVFLKSLIDPSNGRGLSLGNKPMEIAQQLDHNFLPFFDNFKGMPGVVSDLFCQGYSNGTVSKRALFTNADDFHFDLSGSAIFACLKVPRVGEDLIDRSIILSLESIKDSSRKEERNIVEAFNFAQPRIFGGLLDVLVKTIRLKPSISLENLARVGDFQAWGVAASEAMGFDRGTFLNALKGNRKVQAKQVNRNIPLLNEMLVFMNDKSYWQGYPSELLELLKSSVPIPALLPKNAAWLGRGIKEVISPLKDNGIEITIPDSNDGKGKLYRVVNHRFIDTSGTNSSQDDAQNIMMDELISNVMDAQDDGILRDKDSGLRIEPSGPESNV